MLGFTTLVSDGIFSEGAEMVYDVQNMYVQTMFCDHWEG